LIGPLVENELSDGAAAQDMLLEDRLDLLDRDALVLDRDLARQEDAYNRLAGTATCATDLFQLDILSTGRVDQLPELLPDPTSACRQFTGSRAHLDANPIVSPASTFTSFGLLTQTGVSF
jgi:hypothetical protein